MVNIITCARELGMSMQESEEFKRFQAAKEIQESDEALQEKIQEFNLLRQQHISEQNKSSGSKDESKVLELENLVKDMYDEIMEIPVMKEFQSSKQAMDRIMSEVNSILNYYIVGDEGCGSDESSCGGCGGCGGRGHG